MSIIGTANFAGFALAFLLLVVAIVPSATAQHRPETPVDSVTEIAHVTLPGASVSQMFLQEHLGNQYLYIEQLSEEGFTIVDVTKPYRPNVVNGVNLPNKAPRETLQMIGTGLTIGEAPGAETESTRAELASAKGKGALGEGTGGDPTQFVRLLDLSNPGNPRTLQTFDAVSSILLNDGQSLTYITNRKDCGS
jgi:hypothetical protein